MSVNAIMETLNRPLSYQMACPLQISNNNTYILGCNYFRLYAVIRKQI